MKVTRNQCKVSENVLEWELDARGIISQAIIWIANWVRIYMKGYWWIIDWHGIMYSNYWQCNNIVYDIVIIMYNNNNNNRKYHLTILIRSD